MPGKVLPRCVKWTHSKSDVAVTRSKDAQPLITLGRLSAPQAHLRHYLHTSAQIFRPISCDSTPLPVDLIIRYIVLRLVR